MMVFSRLYHICPTSFTLVGLCDEVLSAIFLTHDALNTTRHVDRVACGCTGAGNETIERSAGMERNMGSIGVAWHHIWKSAHRSVLVVVVTARESLGSRKPTLDMIIRLNRYTMSKALGILVRFGCGAESFGDNFKIFTLSCCFFDDLLRCLVGIGSSCVGTRTSPSSLTSGEDSINHVNPIEKRIDKEHERVEPRLKTLQTETEIEHKAPIESERHSNETNRQLRNFLGRGDKRKNQDEKQETGGTNGVLHETNDAKNWVSPPKTDISQHANLVGDKSQEPSTSLLQQTLVRCDGLGFTESSRTHLNLVSLLCTNHEKMGKPSILTQMALSVVEKIVALFSFVREVVFGHLSESRKSKNSKSAGKTGDGTAC